jgi:hypothetical protein
MAEFFRNKYVVQVEHGHPGFTTYTVLSTREDMTALVEALSEALAKPEESLGESLPAPDSPTRLWSGYATTAYGQTSRVSLVFQLVRDLAPYHVRPTTGRRLLGVVWALVVLLVLALAVVGAVASVRYWWP